MASQSPSPYHYVLFSTKDKLGVRVSADFLEGILVGNYISSIQDDLSISSEGEIFLDYSFNAIQSFVRLAMGLPCQGGKAMNCLEVLELMDDLQATDMADCFWENFSRHGKNDPQNIIPLAWYAGTHGLDCLTEELVGHMNMMGPDFDLGFATKEMVLWLLGESLFRPIYLSAFLVSLLTWGVREGVTGWVSQEVLPHFSFTALVPELVLGSFLDSTSDPPLDLGGYVTKLFRKFGKSYPTLEAELLGELKEVLWAVSVKENPGWQELAKKIWEKRMENITPPKKYFGITQNEMGLMPIGQKKTKSVTEGMSERTGPVYNRHILDLFTGEEYVLHQSQLWMGEVMISLSVPPKSTVVTYGSALFVLGGEGPPEVGRGALMYRFANCLIAKKDAFTLPFPVRDAKAFTEGHFIFLHGGFLEDGQENDKVIIFDILSPMLGFRAFDLENYMGNINSK